MKVDKQLLADLKKIAPKWTAVVAEAFKTKKIDVIFDYQKVRSPEERDLDIVQAHKCVVGEAHKFISVYECDTCDDLSLSFAAYGTLSTFRKKLATFIKHWKEEHKK